MCARLTSSSKYVASNKGPRDVTRTCRAFPFFLHNYVFTLRTIGTKRRLIILVVRSAGTSSTLPLKRYSPRRSHNQTQKENSESY